MTEQEWLACTDPGQMRMFLRIRASDRKLRLFACACGRDLLAHNPDAHPDDSRGGARGLEAAILRAEANADGRGPPLPPYSAFTTWVEHPSAERAAAVVVGADPDIGLLVRDPAEAVQDFRVHPAHWLRDLFGPLPFRPASFSPSWRTPDVLNLAPAAYDERILPAGTLDPARLALLADALEDAGCTSANILGHLHSEGPHVRGCWVVDALLGKS
jgi:hypothetical protein